MIITGEKDGKYISGQISESERLEYYYAVIKYLFRIQGVNYRFGDKLDIQESRILIDNLLEDIL